MVSEPSSLVFLMLLVPPLPLLLLLCVCVCARVGMFWCVLIVALFGQATGISLLARVEVYLCLLDGSSKRRLRVTCPVVECCPPECILLGAGVNEVRVVCAWRKAGGAPKVEWRAGRPGP